MIVRRATAMWTVLAVCLGAGVYLVKHEVSALEDRLGTLDREIDDHRAAIHVLRAEWAHLTRPERMEDLGVRLVKLEPVPRERIDGPSGIAALAVPETEVAVAAAGHAPRPQARPKKTAWIAAIMADLEAPR